MKEPSEQLLKIASDLFKDRLKQVGLDSYISKSDYSRGIKRWIRNGQLPLPDPQEVVRQLEDSVKVSDSEIRCLEEKNKEQEQESDYFRKTVLRLEDQIAQMQPNTDALSTEKRLREENNRLHLQLAKPFRNLWRYYFGKKPS